MKAQGEFAQVREVIEQAIRASGQPVKRGSMAHEHELFIVLADSAAEMRDPAGLAKYIGLAEELANRDGHRLYQGIAARARGVERRLAGEPDLARRSFADALTNFEALGTRWQIGRTLCEIAELDRQSGDFREACQNYQSALENFEALDAQPFVERVQTALAEIEQDC